jgi:hypothetical protein
MAGTDIYNYTRYTGIWITILMTSDARQQPPDCVGRVPALTYPGSLKRPTAGRWHEDLCVRVVDGLRNPKIQTNTHCVSWEGQLCTGVLVLGVHLSTLYSVQCTPEYKYSRLQLYLVLLQPSTIGCSAWRVV